MKISTDSSVITSCYHCGEDVKSAAFHIEEKKFCCRGCQTVYEIINQHDLCTYYDFESKPGINQKNEVRKGKFDFLADAAITNKLVNFKQGAVFHVTFYLPQMHCASCIWILEHLHKINQGVLKSTVNFIKKEVAIQYNSDLCNLSSIAESLAQIGYEPHISLNDASKVGLKKIDHKRVLKIGLAGFCFGNIMMLSFPEYFSLGIYEEVKFKTWFSYLNLILSLPVLLYSASEFFISAVQGFKQKFLNIDAPIALAIAITFLRSVYEIINETGSGYLDSMSGIVFFMLIGRYFQNRTYQSISFDRDFTSYFPLGVTVIQNDGFEKQVSVTDLKVGDRIKIFNDEIIPADAILFYGMATIDYSFVTGESVPVKSGIGEIVYAGGKQVSGAIELEVVKEVSQSYLTQLWNNDAFKAEEKKAEKVSFVHAVSRYFTYALFSVAIITAIYWQLHDSTKTWNAVTSILIVACPCALLLSATFTNGSMIQLLNRHKFYVKNNEVIERLARIDCVVFDKTGTITQQKMGKVVFVGANLTMQDKQKIKSIASQSNHPLSKAIVNYLANTKSFRVQQYHNDNGKGIKALIDGEEIKLGSSGFVTGKQTQQITSDSVVYVSINDVCLGYFEIKNNYRANLKNVIQNLKKEYTLKILSGDNDGERQNLQKLFGAETEMLFNQQPQGKLEYIKLLQQSKCNVLMLGDGLNDAGALRQSDVGIAISDNTNNFSPACDVVMAGDQFHLLNDFIRYCNKQKTIIFACFFISILYNMAGLFFAIQGTLEPVIAAILMPISSISIVLLTVVLSSFFGRFLNQKHDKDHKIT